MNKLASRLALIGLIAAIVSVAVAGPPLAPKHLLIFGAAIAIVEATPVLKTWLGRIGLW